MTPYLGNSSSNIIAYKIGEDFITIKFAGSLSFLGINYSRSYTYKSAGKNNVELMKKYALSAHGLSTFIEQYEPKYEKK